MFFPTFLFFIKVTVFQATCPVSRAGCGAGLCRGNSQKLKHKARVRSQESEAWLPSPKDKTQGEVQAKPSQAQESGNRSAGRILGSKCRSKPKAGSGKPDVQSGQELLRDGSWPGLVLTGSTHLTRAAGQAPDASSWIL